jgi:lipoprotein-releasing system permease protein
VSLDWFLAWRYLTARKKGRVLSFYSFISLAGVTLGVMALIATLAVMSGAQKDLRAAILATNAHILVLENGEDIRMSDWEAVLARATTVEGVTTGAPFILTTVALNKSGIQYSQTAQLFGVRADTAGLTGATELEDLILQGAYDLGPTESGLPPILLGSGLADRILAYPGDRITVIAFENTQIGVAGISPMVMAFEMTGTFTTQMYETDVGSAYIRLEDAQELLSLAPSQVSGLGLQTADPDQTGPVAERLRAALGFEYSPITWQDRNQVLLRALKLEKLVLGVILFLIVLVAAFNIASTLIMLVTDKTREIGILKSMGMTDRVILRVFILQGAWIGMVGTGLGTILGLLLSWVVLPLIPIPPDVYQFLDHLPVDVEARDVLTVVGGSMAMPFVATIYPARKAARLQPVEAIRDE